MTDIKKEPVDDFPSIGQQSSLNSTSTTDTEDVVYLGTEIVIRYLQGKLQYLYALKIWDTFPRVTNHRFLIQI